jgi:hypothetical protein
VNLGIRCTGTCFIQKIYAPYKEEEGAYIFWMKQVPVIRWEGLDWVTQHWSLRSSLAQKS